ncbi:MAG: hypothetical protein V2A61_01630 [Calditrichota bacterium]
MPLAQKHFEIDSDRCGVEITLKDERRKRMGNLSWRCLLTAPSYNN